MYLVKKTYDNSPEFLRNEHYENITCTVSDTGVTADTEGKKSVLAGSLLDKDGKAVKVTRGGSSVAYTYAFSTEPVGILFATTEVTHGPQAGALMIAGSVNTERLQGEYLVDAVDQLVEKMPFIKFFVDGSLKVKAAAPTV
nr:MAG TPA: Head decoration protein [Caudoviricetes sp.]